MANGYGSSSSSMSARRSTTNEQGQVAPPGFHYMPDGTLMSDVEHARLYGDKTIRSFNIDLSSLPAIATRRGFTVTGDNDSSFSLEIKNEDNYYYNFETEVFQVSKARLENQTIVNGIYNGSVLFPAITDNDHYDIWIWAEVGTKHADYIEARFEDGSLDINNSIGSNSLLMQKIIYQYTDLTLTLSTFSPLFTVDTGSQSNATFTVPRNSPNAKTSFSVSCAVESAVKSYQIIKQPEFVDALSYITIGLDTNLGTVLPGENIYPAVTGTDTVNGDVTSGVAVTMDSPVATKMAVGDRVTGNTALNNRIVTVVSLDSTNVFSMSGGIAISDGTTLSFSNHMQYQWKTDNIVGINENMKVLGTVGGPITNTESDSRISKYIDSYTLFEGTAKEKLVIENEAPAIKPIGTAEYTDGVLTTQSGEIVFNKQQKRIINGETLFLGGYNKDQILNVTGYSVLISNLKLELTPITTTTTSAVYSSTTVPVSSVNGVLPGVTTVSGIGIDPSAADPTVNNRSVTSGAGNLELSTPQTLESGVVLNLNNSGQTATITGDIEILKSGTSNASIYFDVEKLLSIT